MPVEAQTVEYAYIGDGVTTAFPFPSKFLADTDILVGVDGVLQASGYSANGAGNDNGGSVVFTAAPALAARVVLVRKPPMSQLLDFVNGQSVLENTLDTGLDKLTMIAQYLFRVSQKTVRLSDFDLGTTPELPNAAARAGRLIGFDDDGNLIVRFEDTTQAISYISALYQEILGTHPDGLDVIDGGLYTGGSWIPSDNADGGTF